MPTAPTITLDQPNPKAGDTIHFTVTYDQDDFKGQKDKPYLVLNCFNGDRWIYTASTGLGWGMYPPEGLPFTLESNYWDGEPAKGHATLTALDMGSNRQSKPLATLEFDIAAA